MTFPVQSFVHTDPELRPHLLWLLRNAVNVIHFTPGQIDTLPTALTPWDGELALALAAEGQIVCGLATTGETLLIAPDLRWLTSMRRGGAVMEALILDMLRSPG